MCGFLAQFTSSSYSRNRPRLEAGLDKIKHRGPDDRHVVDLEHAWIGFQRLAILELSNLGRQPRQFSNGRYTLAFNGEIYNFKQLGAIHIDSSREYTSDSEVLGLLLERLPLDEVLGMLRGMFAFVWWDEVEQKLIAARDHYGIKPLYVQNLGQTLNVASELKSLLEIDIAKRIDPIAVEEFLRWGSIQGERSLIQKVFPLKPGHLLEWQAGKLEVCSYYELDWENSHSISGDEAIALTRNVLRDSVQSHLLSDVPVGVFLSGGLDSSILTGLMAEIQGGKIKTFSLGFGSDNDETSVAKQTANFYGTDHYESVISSDVVFEKFDAYIAAVDQPTGDALNTYLVSEEAAKEVKVVLSGLGADEWFGGYTYHRYFYQARRYGSSNQNIRSFTSRAGKLVKKLAPTFTEYNRIGRLAYLASGAAGWSVEDFYQQYRSLCDTDTVTSLLSNVEPQWASHENGSLTDLFVMESNGYLVNTLLRDNDWSSMAHSIELRVPFVDREVQALSASLTDSMFLDSRRGKLVLREAFSDILPSWINEDRSKKGFTIPLFDWLGEEKWKQRICDTLLSSVSLDRGIFLKNGIKNLVNTYYSESNTEEVWKRTQQVWLCFVFEAWCQRHID